MLSQSDIDAIEEDMEYIKEMTRVYCDNIVIFYKNLLKELDSIQSFESVFGDEGGDDGDDES